jgi:phage baseplate assembly protein W
MAAIVIEELKFRDTYNKPLYVDIKLDLNANSVLNPRLESKNVIKDINISLDIDAIKNSLFNLFTTFPGQKILNPIYGLNLMQFVFDGITESNARTIGQLILNGVKRFEPRIDIKKILVIPDIENLSYEIGLRLNVPSLNIDGISLKGTLSESGYYFN